MPITKEQIDALAEAAQSGEPVIGDALVNENGDTYGPPSRAPKEVTDFLADYALGKQDPVEKPSVAGDLIRGIDNLQSIGGGLGALVGNLANLRSVEDWGMEVYRSNEFQASRNPRGVPTYEDIGGMGDAIKYVEQGVMENLPMFVPSLVTGGIGAIAARSAAVGFVEKAIAEQVAKGLTKQAAEEVVSKIVAKRIGISAAVSGLSSSAPMEAGSIYPDVYDETGVKAPIAAMGFGLAAGLFDVIPEGRFFAKALGPALGGKVLKNMVLRMGAEGTKQALLEGSTETIQTIIEETAKHAQDPTYDVFSDSRLKEYVDTFATAAPLGGMMGAVGGMKGPAEKLLPAHPDPLVNEKQKEVEAKTDAIVPEPVIVNPIAEKLDAVNDQIEAITEQHAQLPVDDPQRATLETQLVNLNTERDTLTTELERQIPTDESQISPTPIQGVQSGSVTSQPTGELRGEGTQGQPTVTSDGSEVTVTTTEINPETELQEEVTHKFKKENLPAGVTPEAMAGKMQQLAHAAKALVNENDKTVSDQDKQSYVQAVIKALAPHIPFLTGANITLRKGERAEAAINNRGQIFIQVPTQDYFNARNAKMSRQGGTLRDMNSHSKIIEEEVLHAAVYDYLRDEYKKKGSKSNISIKDFALKNKLAIAKEAKAILPNLPKELSVVYPVTDISDEQFSDELVRMMIQRARTGQLTEDFHKLNAFRKLPRVTAFLKAFINATKLLKASLERLLNTSGATPVLTATIKGVNNVLDKYGVVKPQGAKTEEVAKLLVNENAPATAPPSSKPKAAKPTAAAPAAAAPAEPPARKTTKRKDKPAVEGGFLPTAKVEITPERSTRPTARGLRNYIKEVKTLRSEQNMRIPETKKPIRSPIPTEVEQAAKKEIEGLNLPDLDAIADHADATPEQVERSIPPEQIAPQTVTLAQHIRSQVDTFAQFVNELVKTLGEKARNIARALWKRVNTIIALSLALNVTPVNMENMQVVYARNRIEQGSPMIYYASDLLARVSSENVESINQALTHPSREVTPVAEIQAPPPPAAPVEAVNPEPPPPIGAGSIPESPQPDIHPEDFSNLTDTPVEQQDAARVERWKARALVDEKTDPRVGGSVPDIKPEYKSEADKAIAKRDRGEKLTPMEVAWTFYGEREGQNDRIQKVLDMFGSTANQDKYPWCAPFMSFTIAKSGGKLRSQSSRAFLKAGKKVSLENARKGDIAILWNDEANTGGRDGYGGHVAYLLERDGKFVKLLGGNQMDSVNVIVVHESRLLGVRRVNSTDEISSQEGEEIDNDVEYQGFADGLHAYKELTTNGNFSLTEEENTPERVAQEAQRVRDSFDVPTVNEDNLDDFLRSQGFLVDENGEVSSQEGEEVVWHVTTSDNWKKIDKEGLRPMQTSNFVQAGSGKRYGNGEIYSFRNFDDAVRMAARMDWNKNNTFGSGQIQILAVADTKDWEVDTNDPLTQSSKKGDWLKKMAAISRDKIIKAIPFNGDLAERMREANITPPELELSSQEGEEDISKDPDFKLEMDVAEERLRNVFSATRMMSAEPRLRTGAPSLDLSDVPEVNQEYYTQPRTELLINAAAEIRKRGLFNTVQDLLVEGTAAIDRRWRASGEHPNQPQDVKQAIIEIVRRSLDEIIERYQNGQSTIEDARQVQFIFEARANITDLSIKNLRAAGRAGDILQGFPLFGTRATTLNDYVKLIVSQLKKKFGKGGEDFNRMMVEEINSNARKAVEKEGGRAKVVSYLQKILKDLNDPAWRAAARRSFAKEGTRLRAAVTKMVSMAAQDEFGNFDSEPALKEAMSRLLGAVQFIPKASAQNESVATALSSAITKVFNDEIKNNLLVNEKPKAKTKIEDLQRLSAILQNEELYQKFVDEFEQKVLNKLVATPDASPEMIDRVNRLLENLRTREWSNNLLQSVVVNQAKAMNLNIFRAVKKAELKAKTKLEKIERMPEEQAKERIAAIRDAILKDAATGLSQAKIEQLATAIDNELERKVSDAREKWAGSPGAVRKTIKELQHTINEVAKSGFQRRQQLTNELVSHFMQQMGMADTDKFPHATTLAGLFKSAVEKELNSKREKILEQIKKKAKALGVEALGNEITKKVGSKTALDRIIDIATLGGLEDQDVYNAVQKQLGLPAFNPEDAKYMQDEAERISNMQNPREKKIAQQNLLNYMEARKGLSWKDMTLAYMYASMLSGPGTHLVNGFSNAGNLLGEMAVQIALHPSRTIEVFKNVYQSLTRAKVEFKETLKHGVAAGKEFYKAIGNTPLEYVNPVYNDSFAKGLGKILGYKYVNAKMIGRFLAATDMFFYKAARELSYHKKGGEVGQDTWKGSLTLARQQVEAMGIDPTSRAGRAQMELMAMDHFEQQRSDWELNPVDALRWEEAHSDALRSTFNQEPIGPIGEFARMLGSWSADYPLAKLVVPFTKVVANVLNMQIEWSPLGLARWWWSKDSAFNEGFKNDNGEAVRNPEILARALLGSMATVILGGLLMKADADDPEDPWLTLYGDGPRDANLRRQLYDRGWKPNTIKIKNSFITYQNTVFALPFAALGSLLDRRRENPNMSTWDYAPQAGIAFARSALNQSFLSGLADLVSSVESSSPDKQVQRTMARAATVFVPSLFRQIDAWVDPSVQASENMLDMTIKQVPLVRQLSGLKPQLNVFGQPVKRVQGPFNLPFTNRFWTNERTDDPVLNLIGTHQLSVPGYSKNTKLNNVQMTEEQYYDYIAISGPMVYNRIKQEVPNLLSLTREEMQKRIRDISNMEKDRAREIMKRGKK